MRQRIPAFLVVLFCSWAVLLADLTPEQRVQAKEIENLIIAPCCWRQPVSDHFSPQSDEIREQIAQMVASGMTKDQILQKYVAEYGTRILSKPPAKGFGSLAYFLPVIFLALGAGVAVLVIRRLKPAVAGTPEEPSSAKAVPAKYSAQLEKEMWG